MCLFYERTHNCGHYEKSLSEPCEAAKVRKTVCAKENKTIGSTSGLIGCGIPGCDKKASPNREGPGTFVPVVGTKKD